MISPDGTHIAFDSDRSGDSEVWVCDKDGANALQLTSLGFARDAYWSPDSKSIVFEGRAGDRRLIFVIPAGGGRPRQVSTDEGYKPSWSRDGRWIYYLGRGTGRPQTWKIPAEGGTAIQLTRGGGGPGIESPDGKYFYYHLADAAEIWKVPVAGGEETVVMKEGPNFMNLWAIGPGGLYFSALTDRQMILKLFRFETGRINQIGAVDQKNPAPPRLSLPADGSWLLYDQVDRSESNIMLIENFH
jgi:Tol biopolymer transport system component